MYIGIIGNPVDGFTFYGPFKDPADATDYAERHFYGSDWWWWISNLEPIKETE